MKRCARLRHSQSEFGKSRNGSFVEVRVLFGNASRGRDPSKINGGRVAPGPFLELLGLWQLLGLLCPPFAIHNSSFSGIF
jgi:hypothetical protein